MSYLPIENYGIIGNMRTAALVGMSGSIDWYCYPHFDSPSVFGAILDDKKGGRFQISADSASVRHKQFYWPSTNVLVTRFLLAEGIAELEDFMLAGLPSDSPEYRHLYRRIRCIRGAVHISVTCRPAFDYGRQTHDTRIRNRLDWICERWQFPDAGIWEMRNRQEHFVYSKVMNWVALDRGLRPASKRALPADCAKWMRARDLIYEEVMTRGWNEKRHAFTQFYGSEDLDASLLVMPQVFFMAPSDPRMLSTISAILENPSHGGLVSDSLVHRYPPQPRVDGLPGEERTFNMCSFWLVEALTRAGQTLPDKLEQAKLLFERVLGYANHLGLYSEQTGQQGEALGNFPQALTHLALISAAFNLNRTLEARCHGASPN